LLPELRHEIEMGVAERAHEALIKE
jgi:hypothetical protein